MKLTKNQVRQMRRESMAWPVELKAIARAQWPRQINGHNCESSVPRFAVWRSREFLVQAFDEGGGIVRLSVNRCDWDFNAQRFREDITWDDLQRLKAEAGFSNFMAVEIFPVEANVVNVANMRHLWVLPVALPFGWGRALARNAA